MHFIDIRGIDGHNIAALPVEHAKVVRKKLDDAGIQVGMFGSPVGKIDIKDDMKIEVDRLNHMAQLAPVLGCNAIRMFSFYNKTKISHAEFQALALGRLSQLRDQARKLGLVLYHENEAGIFGDRCEDVLTITRQLRDPASFRMIFDFGNYNHGKEDVWQNWLNLRDTTDAIHIKDNLWQGEQFFHMPAGMGNGRIPEILADAAARGWQGPLTLEPHLQHSAAVVATGPSGVANQAYSNIPLAESFDIAAKAARAIFKKINAPVA
jgi:sugar phosphate isomerase/epimerase